MSTRFQTRARIGALLAVAVAIVSWAIALGEAVQRLALGRLCSTREDAWASLSHCPACVVALTATLLGLTLLVRMRTPGLPEHAVSR